MEYTAKATDYVKDHVGLVVAFVVVLIIIVIVYCVYRNRQNKSTMIGRKDSENFNADEEELDRLLSSIRRKQKANLKKKK